VDGRLFQHAGESKFPKDWRERRDLADSSLRIEFTEPNERFDLTLRTPTLHADLRFRKARPTFDFAACRVNIPENTSFRELMTLGTGMPHDHHQQALTVQGTVIVRDEGSSKSIALDGLGYRDHSWCMRGDNLIARHTFCGLLFPSRAIGVKTAQMLSSPETWAREGYVADEHGSLPLRGIDVQVEGLGPDELGETVRFDLADSRNNPYTIEAHVSERLSYVPFISQKPGIGGGYRIVDSLCPIVLMETGERGLGHVELGMHSE
jgi:hypothetical protein